MKHSVSILMVGDSLQHNGGIAAVEKLILQHVPSGITVAHIATHESGSAAHRIKIFGQGLFSLIRSLLTQQIDVVHIHLADWGSVVRKSIVIFISMIFRKAIVVHAHGPEFHLTYQSLPGFARQLLSWLLQQSDQFIVLSEKWRRFYVDDVGLDEKRVLILPNPIELPASIPDRSGATNLKIVFMGRIGQRKGAFDLIQAFAQLPELNRQSVQLLLAGDGDLEQAQLLVEELNLTNCVKFLGWIDTEARNRLLSQAHIFVLPSYNEALPMALLEAMAWQLPVITCPVGGIPDFIVSNQHGLLVQPGNIQQLAESLQHLIEDEALRQSLAQSARDRVTALNVQDYIVQLEKVYHGCHH